MALSVHSDEYFMQQALKEAEIAYEEGEIPVGAVVVSGNRIIARAHNQVERLNDSTAHAEILALTSAFNHFGAKYLPDCTLYVTLEPCIMCAGAILWSQLGKLVYGADDPKRGYQGSRIALHPRTEIVPGIMKEECGMIVSRFFSRMRGK